MKKTLLTLVLVGASVAAFAQGKVSLQNDSGSLYTLSATPAAPDAALAGMPIPISGPLPSGAVLFVGLYGGTTSANMTLQTEVLLNPAGGGGGPSDGQPAFTHVVTSLPGGTLQFFQVFVWDNRAATPALAKTDGFYEGQDNIFQMSPSTTIAYPPINGGGGSTWAAVGNESPLIVSIPEPTTFALAGLGATALLLFRRRK